MMRVVAAALALTACAVPLTIYPVAPVTWLVLLALGAQGLGIAVLAVPVVTAGGTLTLVAYAVALLIVQPALNPVGAIALGASLTALVLVVHFAARTQGAALGPTVLATQARECLRVVAAGVIGAATLAIAATALAAVLRALTLPSMIGAAALGALVAMAGGVALAVRHDAAAE